MKSWVGQAKQSSPVGTAEVGRTKSCFPSAIVDGAILPRISSWEIISRPFGTALFYLVYPGFHPGLRSVVPAGLRLENIQDFMNDAYTSRMTPFVRLAEGDFLQSQVADVLCAHVVGTE